MKRAGWLVALFIVWCAGSLTTATLTQPSFAQGANYSLRFYGHGVSDIDRVKIRIDPHVPADVGAGDFTFEFWLKANAGENTGAASCNTEAGWITANIIFDRDVYGGGDVGDYGIVLNGGKIAFGVSQGTSGTTLCGATNVANSTWHHIALTRNATTGQIRIFVDGTLDGQTNTVTGNVSYRDGRTTSFPNSDPYLVIGAEKHDAGAEYPSFKGWVDEVRISNAIRYTANFTRPSAPFMTDANTVALYHFDEGPAGLCTSNQTILDSSGASGGPSNGTCKPGGSGTAGPVYTTDVPFVAGSPTNTSTATATATNTPTYTRTNTPTNTLAATPTNTPTATPTLPPAPSTNYLPLILKPDLLIWFVLGSIVVGLIIYFFAHRAAHAHDHT